jgi:glycosyltransferase involved in cell wall biosynthesis
LKPLEAMALKKVVIGSNVGGIKELVKDDYNGILFEKENVGDLIEKCEYAVDQFENIKVMAENGRRYVEEERTWLGSCRRYLPVFKELGAI